MACLNCEIETQRQKADTNKAWKLTGNMWSISTQSLIGKQERALNNHGNNKQENYKGIRSPELQMRIVKCTE